MADVEQEFLTNPNPVSGTEEAGLTCGNTEVPTGQQAVSLEWTRAKDRTWAKHHRAKLDAAPGPAERADAAWWALRSAVKRLELSAAATDELYAELGDWLLERTNALAPSAADQRAVLDLRIEEERRLLLHLPPAPSVLAGQTHSDHNQGAVGADPHQTTNSQTPWGGQGSRAGWAPPAPSAPTPEEFMRGGT